VVVSNIDGFKLFQRRKSYALNISHGHYFISDSDVSRAWASFHKDK
jgi:hypothetical protein